MKVKRDEVWDWGLPIASYNDEVKIISDTIVGHGRWSVSHRLLVEIDGVPYVTSYSRGATEYQDEQPWEDEEYVTFTPVVEVVKSVKVYMEKCPEYPTYRVILPPTADCKHCQKMWSMKNDGKTDC